jgi:hypothetical protein
MRLQNHRHVAGHWCFLTDAKKHGSLKLNRLHHPLNHWVTPLQHHTFLLLRLQRLWLWSKWSPALPVQIYLHSSQEFVIFIPWIWIKPHSLAAINAGQCQFASICPTCNTNEPYFSLCQPQMVCVMVLSTIVSIQLEDNEGNICQLWYTQACPQFWILKDMEWIRWVIMVVKVS